MRKIQDCRKGFSDAGISEIAREDRYETANINGLIHKSLAELDSEEHECSMQKDLASPSAEFLGQDGQASNQSGLLTLGQPEEFLETRGRSLDEGESIIGDEENLSFVRQTNQQSFISNAFPDLIWESFNPIQQTPHRGTIDPRIDPVPFEDLLKTFLPQQFSLKPSFPIDMAITRGRGRNYRNSGRDRLEQARMTMNQHGQEKGIETSSQMQRNIEGLVESVEDDGYGFQQPHVSGIPLLHEETAEDVLEASELYAVDAITSSKPKIEDDDASEHQDSGGQRKRASQLPTAMVKSTNHNRTYGTDQKMNGIPKQKQPGLFWQESEIKATSEILQEIRGEDQHKPKPITINRLYAETSRRLEPKGIYKSASAIRSYWNRYGRSHPLYGFDERKNPNNEKLAVGLQQNRSKKGRAQTAQEAEKVGNTGNRYIQQVQPSIGGARKRKAAVLGASGEIREQRSITARMAKPLITERRPDEQHSSEQRPTGQRGPDAPARMDSEELNEARERVPSSDLEDFEGDYSEYHPRIKKSRRKGD